MRTTVFGTTGRTGQPFVEQALERGHEVVAFVRNATSLPPAVWNDDRVGVVAGDAYTGERVERAIAGDGDPVDAVVSVLVQPSEGPDDLLTAAGRQIRASIDRHGVDRFVLFSERLFQESVGEESDYNEPAVVRDTRLAVYITPPIITT